MQKTKLNYIIDFLAFLSFIAVSVSGLVIFFFLPSGVPRGRFQEFLGIQKDAWSEIHNWSGIILIALVLIHLFLHWDGIVCMTKNFFKSESCENKPDNQIS